MLANEGMLGNYSCKRYKNFNGEVEDAGKVDFPALCKLRPKMRRVPI